MTTTDIEFVQLSGCKASAEWLRTINQRVHTDGCACKGTFDERCKAMAPAGVSGAGASVLYGASAGERRAVPEVPAGVI